MDKITWVIMKYNHIVEHNYNTLICLLHFAAFDEILFQ